MRAFRPNSRTLVSASGLAVATALVASAPVARAQSFQGSVASTFGSVSVTTGTNTTDVTVFSPSAVINWTPGDQAATGGPIDFQPTGTTATFTNGISAGSDFVVLNRIVPVGSTRPIQFNGNVISQLQGANGPTPGGTVFFYSPGGILVGSNAVFDVGSLVLTASDLAYDAAGNFDSSGSYQFQPATVPGAQVQVQSGAQINAPTDGSYIAMIAPSVVNAGAITVNGSAAVVAADAATITFSPNGMFDIQVDSGTSASGTVAANTGSITGPAASDPSIVHRIYMVAVAKNDAITMALGSGSTLGFDIAGAADVVGNSIVLSAGSDISGGGISLSPSPGGGAGLASITANDADFTSDLVGQANGSILLQSSSASGMELAANAKLQGGVGGVVMRANASGSVAVTGYVDATGVVPATVPGGDSLGTIAQLTATDGGILTVGGFVNLTADSFGGAVATTPSPIPTVVGGDALINANNGGQISISGDVLLSSAGRGGDSLSSDAAGTNGTGGQSRILATGTAGSSVTVNGSVNLFAEGYGGTGTGSQDSGAGLGGTTQIGAGPGGQITLNGASLLSSRGIGGAQGGSPPAGSPAGFGGDGTGGNAYITSSGGTITANSDVVIDASGFGGFGSGDFASGGGGDGNGGTALLAVGSDTAPGNGGAMTFGGQTFLSADGTGGDGYAGGQGFGGTSSIYARYGDLVFDSVSASASAFGGYGTLGGSGGAATGGGVDVVAQNALEGASSIFIDQLTADGSAFGGFGSDAALSNSVGGNGGRADAGGVLVVGGAGNGVLEVVTVSAFANATGGSGGVGSGAAGGNGGDATGGPVQIGLASGIDTGSLNAGSATFGTISAYTHVNGGNGGDSLGGPPPGAGGNGGNVSGGGVSLLVRGAPVTITGFATFDTTLTGGNGGAGATAGTGGNALLGDTVQSNVAGSYALVTNRFNQPAQAGSLTAGDLSFSASANGGTGSVNGTGTIIGGAVEFRATNSTINANSMAFVAFADGQTATATTDAISLVNSTASIATGLSFQTPSTVSLTLDQSTITADQVFISGGNWALDGAAPATLGTLTGTTQLVLSSGQDLVAHANLQTPGSLSLLATGRIDLGALTAGSFVYVSSGSTVSLDDVTAGDSIDLVALGAVVTGSMTAATSISVETAGSVTTANLAAGTGTPSGANGDIYSVGIRSGGNVATGSIFAASDLGIGAVGSISTGDIAAYDMLLLGGGDISTGAINAVNRVLIADVSMADIGATANGFDKELVFAANPVTPTAGNITIAGPASVGQLTASTLGQFTSGAINGDASVLIFGNAVTAGDVSATGLVGLFAENSLVVGNVTSSLFDVRVAAGTSDGNGGFVPGQGSVSTGNIQAGGRVKIGSGGNIATGSLGTSGADGVKVVSVGGSIATGNISTPFDVFISGMQSVGTGQVQARDIALLSGGSVSTGSLASGLVFTQSPTGPTVTNATGRVLLASASMLTGPTLLADTTDFNALFAAIPVRLGGSVTTAGQVVAGRFVSYSQGDMTGQRIAAFGSIDVESGGLVTVGQRWGAPSVTIASADIRIIDNGSATTPTGQQILSGLRSSATGEVALISLSGSPALIGDGLTGSGYALGNAEIGLISAHQLTIGAVDVASNPVDMLIGDVTFTAGNAIGSATLGDANGFVFFATGNRATQTPSGAIRVVGDVTGSGFTATNIVEFDTGRFELDAETATLSLTQSGTILGGIVEIHADNIHIASGAILDRLAADPFYAGHVLDLNSPAAIQKREGVLRALGLDFYPTGTLYIQNTGTTLDPAGFFADFDFTDLTPPANAAPASISVIVNGRWQTAGGIVGGIAARDLVVNNAGTLAFYTPDSTVNGCAINASACALLAEIEPVPSLSSQIEIITENPLGDTPQFVEEPSTPAADESEEQAAEEARAAEKAASEAKGSPIVPPPQIIDSSPLDPQSLVEQPVAGSGNPSLIGSVVNEGSAEGNKL